MQSGQIQKENVCLIEPDWSLNKEVCDSKIARLSKKSNNLEKGYLETEMFNDSEIETRSDSYQEKDSNMNENRTEEASDCEKTDNCNHVRNVKNSEKYENSENLNKKKTRKLYNKKEILNLIYMVEKEGKDFCKIATKFKEYFRNRNCNSLEKKYKRLESDSFNFRRYKKEVKLRKIKKIDSIYNEQQWTYEEHLYLMSGISKFGKKWNKILEIYGHHFNKILKSVDLQFKYRELRKDPTKYENLMKDAKLFITEHN